MTSRAGYNLRIEALVRDKTVDMSIQISNNILNVNNVIVFCFPIIYFLLVEKHFLIT